MGAAMLAGWRKQGLAPSVVIDPAPGAASLASDGVKVVTSADAVPDGFVPAVIVLAVKPQTAGAAVPGIARFAESALVVSIMAGRTIAGVQALIGVDAVVRAMPNTPAAIGRGFTAAFAAPGVSAAQRELCETLLTAIGAVAWVDTESQIDAVTAVSGGGPAYVFLLTELLAAAAMEQGLPPDLAQRMARATVSGSGALLDATDEDPAAMRRAVTSPAGTTERALAVLMAPEAWPDAMSRAIAAATTRSRELSQ
jgi:pyrroline-5-carboxylate reductase